MISFTLCGEIVDSQTPNATLALLTMELNCAAEAWLTVFASVDEVVLVEGLGLALVGLLKRPFHRSRTEFLWW